MTVDELAQSLVLTRIVHPDAVDDALGYDDGLTMDRIEALRRKLQRPERTLTDEIIADLWHQNGGFHHHFARAVERYLKGEE